MLYETISGDTWDQIAKEVYGSEIHADYLMKNNPRHLATVLFKAGELLYIPDLPSEDNDGVPDWRQ